MELQTLQRAREADGGVLESIHVWETMLVYLVPFPLLSFFARGAGGTV